MRGYLAEKAVTNWYTIFYEGTVELVDGYKHDKVVDILVTFNDKKIIGVGVKNVSLKRINEVKHKISSTLKADLFFQKNLSDFYEFHFVIVLADYIEKFEFKAYTLKNILGGTYESASGDFTRKEFTKLLDEVKSAKQKPFAIAIKFISRFSRTGGNAITIVQELVDKLGVHLIETSSGLCTNDEYSKLDIYGKLLDARRENMDRLEKTIPEN